jgi:hypothetical protein
VGDPADVQVCLHQSAPGCDYRRHADPDEVNDTIQRMSGLKA